MVDLDLFEFHQLNPKNFCNNRVQPAEVNLFSAKVDFSRLMSTFFATLIFLHQNRTQAFFCHFDFSRLNSRKFHFSLCKRVHSATPSSMPVTMAVQIIFCQAAPSCALAARRYRGALGPLRHDTLFAYLIFWNIPQTGICALRFSHTKRVCGIQPLPWKMRLEMLN